jgi:hypothetical protein
MKTISLLHKGVFAKTVGENPTPPPFFPRIIREFEEKDEPMIYGDSS